MSKKIEGAGPSIGLMVLSSVMIIPAILLSQFGFGAFVWMPLILASLIYLGMFYTLRVNANSETALQRPEFSPEIKVMQWIFHILSIMSAIILIRSGYVGIGSATLVLTIQNFGGYKLFVNSKLVKKETADAE
tara:strand:+ start:36 stop:434 length:399 start_codon:yes stop_codon:yes gene_type:complete